MKKRIPVLILSLLLMLSLASCGQEKKEEYAGSAETAKEIDAGALPEGFGEFIVRFHRYSDSGNGMEYDCTRTEDSTILKCILIHGGCADWSVYGMPQPEYHNREDDPASRQTGEGYRLVLAENADRIAREIFHVSEEALEKMREEGDRGNVFYVSTGEDGCEYYVILDMMGAGDNAVKIVPRAVRYDGERYYIVYDRCEPDAFTPPGTENRVFGQGYAVMGYGSDGFWNMYMHSMTIPEVFGL